MLLWPILIIAVVAGAVWYMRNPDGGGLGPTRSRGALDVLEQRYARGEIDREEYLQKRRDIEAGERGA
jgi:putative membrane protein